MDPSDDDNGNRFTVRGGKVVPRSRRRTRDRDFSRFLRGESEERIVGGNAGAGAGGGKVGSLLPGSRDEVEMIYVDGGDHKGYAATVEAGRRRTCDEEEGVWGVPSSLLLHGTHGAESMVAAAGEGIVKTVHLNQYAE